MDIVSETTRNVIDRRRLELLTHLQSLLGSFDDRAALPRVLAGLADADHPDLAEIDVPPVRVGPPAGRPARQPAAVRPERVRSLDDDLLLEETDRGRVAWLPLRSSGSDPADPPVLVVALSDRLPADPHYLEFLTLIGAVVSQALDRLHLLEAERRNAMNERRMSEALQRSLLTPPVQQPGLKVAVRYLPASHHAQIGGDWYDAFTVRDGALTLAIGDVTGHDREAAAAMGQVRNLMRGIAFTLAEPPSGIMVALDEAIHGLNVGTSATAVLAKVESSPGTPPGSYRLRWTVAGHLPPR